MSSNNQSNQIIRWMVIITDFLVLNGLLYLLVRIHPRMEGWTFTELNVFTLVCNFSLLVSEYRFSTLIHMRIVTAAEILQRVVLLTMTQTVTAYVIWKLIDFNKPVGWQLFQLGTVLFVVLLVARFIQRTLVKHYRRSGRNTRTAIFVGNDPELLNIYDRLVGDPTMGYRILGYYADTEIGEWTRSISSHHTTDETDGQRENESSHVKELPHLPRLGTLAELAEKMKNNSEPPILGDEMYVSISRRDKDLIRKLSKLCDQRVIRFYYVPVSVESIGINLKREMMDDMEVFTTYENPLENPVNKTVKRIFDIVMSLVFLIPTILLLPIIYIIVKTQSPGPLFFKQLRTGIDGKDFYCYKFRSMHVNKDADKVQATKNDPRKYAFGNFMRKMNIDELPQFWNVLKGDMSIVGPRPHMLAHTEQYSALIDKYMVRHFVKPGVTGWAQVTGFRGETKELWQMEGRVKRDIWYMEHWSIWLDIRIIWLTAKTMVIHDKNAY